MKLGMPTPATSQPTKMPIGTAEAAIAKNEGEQHVLVQIR